MIDLTGLETRPAQTWGAIRMVPLVRREPITDLRLHRRLYDRDDHEVDLPDRTFYTSYIPHAYVAVWGDNAPEVSYGTQFGDLKDTVRLGTIPRLARRTNPGRLRFLPSTWRWRAIWRCTSAAPRSPGNTGRTRPCATASRPGRRRRTRAPMSPASTTRCACSRSTRVSAA